MGWRIPTKVRQLKGTKVRDGLPRKELTTMASLRSGRLSAARTNSTFCPVKNAQEDDKEETQLCLLHNNEELNVVSPEAGTCGEDIVVDWPLGMAKDDETHPSSRPLSAGSSIDKEGRNNHVPMTKAEEVLSFSEAHFAMHAPTVPTTRTFSKRHGVSFFACGQWTNTRTLLRC
jgi:hypothetical protein